MTDKKPAEGLTRLRQEHKWSLKTLAEQIGVTPATVWQWEQDEGKIKNKQLKQLSEVFSEDELRQAFPDKYSPQQYQEDEPIINDDTDYAYRSCYSYRPSWSRTIQSEQQQQPNQERVIRRLPPAEEERLSLLSELLEMIPKMTSHQLRVMIQYAHAIDVEYN